MKIILFVENNHSGGMDTFFVNLINHWPFIGDEITLICNKDHPGLPYIKKGIKNHAKIIEHNIILSTTIIIKWFWYFPNIFKKIFRTLLKIILFKHQLKELEKLFKNFEGDKLLSVNGAYPGGESCRIANIAWFNIKNEKSIHNIRNFAIPPRRL